MPLRRQEGPVGKGVQLVIRQRAQTIKIGAEANGEEVEEQVEEEVVDRCPCEVEDQEEDDRVVDVEEVPQILTLLRATIVGCVAI